MRWGLSFAPSPNRVCRLKLTFRSWPIIDWSRQSLSFCCIFSLRLLSHSCSLPAMGPSLGHMCNFLKYCQIIIWNGWTNLHCHQLLSPHSCWHLIFSDLIIFSNLMQEMEQSGHKVICDCPYLQFSDY